jgi:hypothetical protein
MELAKSLLERDRVFTVGYDQGRARHRVTPHVFTQPKEPTSSSPPSRVCGRSESSRQ